MLYRGIDKSHFDYQCYTKGKRVVWNSFTSCSKTELAAKKFMKDPLNGVFFFIDSEEGRQVGKLTPYPEEDEILLEPSSEFEVTGLLPIANSFIVTMKQLPSRRPLLPLHTLPPPPAAAPFYPDFFRSAVTPASGECEALLAGLKNECYPTVGQLSEIFAKQGLAKKLTAVTGPIPEATHSFGVRRLQTEFTRLRTNPLAGFGVELVADCIGRWAVTMQPPDFTPYRGSVLHLEMVFPEGYPVSSPRVRFTTPVFHPGGGMNRTSTLGRGTYASVN
eukprot:TRINITY_DN2456_c0_g1_i2.p1 TRINITY_DN2456_c0_g1~~TRINITY_DN2456_c0_g1_i2.p1  ORF type:complete len:276 (-),score=42.39 TRINITY_DN2456_c0_g1_i2:332-1159(-)